MEMKQYLVLISLISLCIVHAHTIRDAYIRHNKFKVDNSSFHYLRKYRNFTRMCTAYVKSLQKMFENDFFYKQSEPNTSRKVTPKDTIKRSCRLVCQRLTKMLTWEIPSMTGILPNANNTLNFVEKFGKIAEYNLPQLPGGMWTPQMPTSIASQQCLETPTDSVVIVFAMQNRWAQLAESLGAIIPLLQTQELCYRIFVIEQKGLGSFNKGSLKNIAFLEASIYFPFSCIIFHDVNLVVISDQLPYGCDLQTLRGPIDLGEVNDNRNYSRPYRTLTGGVLKISAEHFAKVNGYSNLYWMWGGEEDDMHIRIRSSGLKLHKLLWITGRYRSFYDNSTKINRFSENLKNILLKGSSSRRGKDGLNSIKYRVLSVKFNTLFTHMMVDIQQPPPCFSNRIANYFSNASN